MKCGKPKLGSTVGDRHSSGDGVLAVVKELKMEEEEEECHLNGIEMYDDDNTERKAISLCPLLGTQLFVLRHGRPSGPHLFTSSLSLPPLNTIWVEIVVVVWIE